MNTIPPASGKTSPKDFFLWVGTVIALYGSVIAFISLLFAYINRVYPDPLAGYGDIYGGGVRSAMATLIVLIPATIALTHVIRKVIVADPSKEGIWVRRWALVLTLFLAGVTVAIDLITLINTFLGGEITTRFVLKAVIVLLVALGLSMHFLADLKGYWLMNPKKANVLAIAVAVVSLLVVVSGFVIFGTPQEMRQHRYDDQKVADLQNIQGQIVNYWQTKHALPKSLADLNDSLTGYVVPNDAQSGQPYTYHTSGPLAFELCAAFNLPTDTPEGQGVYPSVATYPTAPGFGVGALGGDWEHGSGDTCFPRTIDPERLPQVPGKTP